MKACVTTFGGSDLIRGGKFHCDVIVFVGGKRLQLDYPTGVMLVPLGGILHLQQAIETQVSDYLIFKSISRGKRNCEGQKAFWENILICFIE